MSPVLVSVCVLLFVMGQSTSSLVLHRERVPVRERQDASLCRYQVKVDYDATRIPDRIDKVLCRQEGCKCVEAGDYRCTQLYTQLNVSYITPTASQYDILDVELACVCARSVSSGDMQDLNAKIV